MNEKLRQRIESGEMPNKTTYVIWTAVGFLVGILWGVLALFPYMKMSKAIEANDIKEAWINAGKVQSYVGAGIILSIVFLVIRLIPYN